MISPEQITAARTAGLAALDSAEREIRGALPQASALSNSERLARAKALRMDFARNHHLNTKGRPLDFSEAWLIAIYEDDSPFKVMRKCVQFGGSEYLVVYGFADAAVGRTVFHVLPTYSIRNRFVATRVDRPLLMVERYRQLQFEALGDADSRMLKHLARGAIYYVGSNTPNEFIEIAAETAIVDEVDRCDQENLVMVPDRLQGCDAAARVQIYAGNPTHAEFGISELYEKSDQRDWQIKCRACNTWQPLDFFENVLRVQVDAKGEIARYDLRDATWREHLDRDIACYCIKCGKQIDRLENDPKHAQWIAANPGHASTGWTISRLMTKRSQVREIYLPFVDSEGDPTKRARVINNLLGRPYSPPGSALTDAMLNACKRPYAMPQQSAGPCTMGIDVGKLWDVRISDQPEPEVRRACYLGRVDGPERCLELIARYNVRSIVIDARPETRLAQQFQKQVQARYRRGSREWMCWRAEFPSGETIKELHKDHAEGIVKMDRTAIFDAAMADITAQRNWLPNDAHALIKGEYYKQMKVPKRIAMESESGQRYVWTKGIDHQRLADVYDKMACLVAGNRLRARCGGRLCAVVDRN